LLPGAVFVMALIQSRAFRRWCLRQLLQLWRQLYHVAVVLPSRLFPMETLQRVVNSWVFQLLSWYVLKPGLITLAVYLLLADQFRSWFSLGLVFVMATALLTSRPGRVTTEATQDMLMQFLAKLREGFLGGLVRL